MRENANAGELVMQRRDLILLRCLYLARLWQMPGAYCVFSGEARARWGTADTSAILDRLVTDSLKSPLRRLLWTWAYMLPIWTKRG